MKLVFGGGDSEILLEHAAEVGCRGEAALLRDLVKGKIILLQKLLGVREAAIGDEFGRGNAVHLSELQAEIGLAHPRLGREIGNGQRGGPEGSKNGLSCLRDPTACVVGSIGNGSGEDQTLVDPIEQGKRSDQAPLASRVLAQKAGKESFGVVGIFWGEPIALSQTLVREIEIDTNEIVSTLYVHGVDRVLGQIQHVSAIDREAVSVRKAIVTGAPQDQNKGVAFAGRAKGDPSGGDIASEHALETGYV